MSGIYKVRVGKQGRIVLPKEVREEFKVKLGDEVTFIIKDHEITLRLHKVVEDLLEGLARLSQTVSIGMKAKELKEKADEERIKDLLNHF